MQVLEEESDYFVTKYEQLFSHLGDLEALPVEEYFDRFVKPTYYQKAKCYEDVKVELGLKKPEEEALVGE